MKTYILSVNILTWNLTSERHDNCAPCLGLILPMRWVTPPPNSSFEVFFSWRYICYVFAFGLSSISTCLHDYLHYVDFIAFLYIYTSILSSTSFTYSYVFLVESFELSECDRTLTPLCFFPKAIYPNHMHSIDTVKMSSFHPCQ